MTTPSLTRLDDLSISVMTHPLRRHLARDVVAALHPLAMEVAVDPDPWNTPRTLRTSIEAWRRADPDRAYHLVLQDDVVLSPDFTAHLADIVSTAPDVPVALGAVWISRNGCAVRWAAAQGARFVEAIPEFLPCLGLLMPTRLARRYVEFASSWPDPDTPDDVVMQEFVAREAVRPLLTVPSIVDQRPVHSLIGNDYGIIRAACFGSPPPGWFAEDKATITGYTALPVLRQGRLSLYTDPGGRYGGPWDKAPFERSAHRLGWDVDRLAERYDAFLAAAPRELSDRWFRLVGPRVLWTAWLTAHAMRHFPAPGHVPDLPDPDPMFVDTALRTILTGGFLELSRPTPVQRTLMDEIDTLLPIAVAGYRAPLLE
ncbi:hypothetical protein [Streptomyces sp. NPDC014894]|uniref:hypothetical protein n=1 Tax=unclassified Streptomyces TaxID=2593676 RepID=UPI0036FD6D7C